MRRVASTLVSEMSEATPPTETIERAYRVRLYPKPDQAHVLSRLFGARRFVWNWAIRRKREAWHADGTRLSGVDLSREFTELRKTGDTAWLSELPREPFNQTLRDFDKGWKNFFAGRAKRPRRKKYMAVHSARFTLDQRRKQVNISARTVQIDGIGRVRMRVSEPMVGRLRSVTVSRDSAGRWFAAFAADQVPAPAVGSAASGSVGVDLGLKDTAALSDGTAIAAPKHLAKNLKRLRRYSRQYARRYRAAANEKGVDPNKPIPKGTRIKPSKNMGRTKRRIGKIHARIADMRRDHQHQLTAKIVSSADVIVIEDLSIKGMSRSMGRRAFRRSVADAGLGEIRRQITYKASWHKRAVVAVDRFFPSSQLCSTPGCDYRNKSLKLSERQWTCPQCQTTHGRDSNAAINIEREGIRLLAQAPCPDDGRTRRSRETNARGEYACAVTRLSVIGQPSSLNHELTYRAAKPPITQQSRDGPAPRVEG